MDEQPIMNDEQPIMDEQPDLTEEQLSNILDEGIQICADLIDINQIPQRLADITAIVSSINNIGIYSLEVQHKYFMLSIMEQGILFPEMTVELFFVADVNDDWIYDLEDVPKQGLSKNEVRHVGKRLRLKQSCNELEIPSCSICLENFKKTEFVFRLQCRHYFHEDCIVTWFEKNKVCPLCMKEVEKPAQESVREELPRACKKRK